MKALNLTSSSLWRLGLWIVLGAALLSVSWVLALRWINPPGPSTGQWRSLAQIPVELQQAVVLSEDARFCMHEGFDWVLINAALTQARQGERLVGASSLSQQVAKNVFLWKARSWGRKILEAWFTFWVERLWSKPRILEVYLNVAEWGPGMFGADAALKALPSAQMDPYMAAHLAVLLPSPIRYREKLPEGQQAKKIKVAEALLSGAQRQAFECLR